jgi:hypothetical protein
VDVLKTKSKHFYASSEGNSLARLMSTKLPG